MGKRSLGGLGCHDVDKSIDQRILSKPERRVERIGHGHAKHQAKQRCMHRGGGTAGIDQTGISSALL